MTNSEIFTKITKDSSDTKNNDGLTDRGEIKESVGYTISDKPSRNKNGHYDFSTAKTIEESDKNCFAKKVSIKTSKKEIKNKYYVKSNLQGFLFDPWGLFSEGTQGDYARGYGKSAWSFKEVPEKCFDFYVKFLQSKNQAWFKNAERECR